MTTHHLARSLDATAAVAWLSTPYADLLELRRAASIADSRALRAALDHGRASSEYIAAAVDLVAADAAVAAAEGRVDATIQSTIALENVLKSGTEYMVVRGITQDTVELGRGAFGSTAAAHGLGAVVYKADLRVEATFNIELIVEGESGAEISAGDKGDIIVPFAGRISQVRIVADQPGDLVVDVLRAAFPAEPVVSIVGLTLPFLASTDDYGDSTLTGWDVACAEDDVLRVLVVSANLVTRVTISLTYTTTTIA